MPMRVRIPETVVSGMRSTSAISAPVMRRRRSAAITWKRSSGVHAPGGRGAIEQSSIALGPEAPHPLAGAALADFGGRGRLRQRPTLAGHARYEQLALLQAEGSVTVELHSVSSL